MHRTVESLLWPLPLITDTLRGAGHAQGLFPPPLAHPNDTSHPPPANICAAPLGTQATPGWQVSALREGERPCPLGPGPGAPEPHTVCPVWLEAVSEPSENHVD